MEKSVDVELYCHPIKIGGTRAIQTYVKDITERKKQEKAQYKMNMQIIELAARVVPLLEGIAVLPLLGVMNQNRAEQILELVPVNVQEQGVSRSFSNVKDALYFFGVNSKTDISY